MYKTWIEINQKALKNNLAAIHRQLSPKTNLWAVIKSNAYGHGLWTFAKLATALQYKGKDAVTGFCVDSVTEGLKLRDHGIIKPILVLGPTMDGHFKLAKAQNIILSISNHFALNQLVNEIKDPNQRPEIHLKIDTGMNRQGFSLSKLDKVASKLKKEKINITGVFSHLASAKDINYPTFSSNQLKKFRRALVTLKRHGFTKLNRHLAATAGSFFSRMTFLAIMALWETAEPISWSAPVWGRVQPWCSSNRFLIEEVCVGCRNVMRPRSLEERTPPWLYASRIIRATAFSAIFDISASGLPA